MDTDSIDGHPLDLDAPLELPCPGCGGSLSSTLRMLKSVEDFPPCGACGASLTEAHRTAFAGSVEESLGHAMREARNSMLGQGE